MKGKQMKKLLAIAVAIVAGSAFGVQVFDKLGAEVGQFQKFQCGPNITCSQSTGRLLFNTGIVKQVAATTTSATAAQCGSTFINSAAGHVLTLPEASTVLGCRYTFVCGDAQDFDINPADGTDTIGSVSTTNGSTAVVTLAPSAGDAIRCTDAGGAITLEATGADAWTQVAGGNGIWTDVN